MAKYHATMIDECGDEYGMTLDVDDNVDNVTEYFREMFPESRVLFVEPGDAPPRRAHFDYMWEQRAADDTWDLY